jgi:hypothetical protein
MIGCRPGDPAAPAPVGGGAGGTSRSGGATGAQGSGGNGPGATGGAFVGAGGTGGGTGSGDPGGNGFDAGQPDIAANGGGNGTGGGPSGTAGRNVTGGTSGGGNAGGAGRGGDAGNAGPIGGGGGAGAGAPTCTDGKKNGDETGVDCGATCPACPNYKVNPPNLKNNAQSSCGGGQGFMCTRSMAFSPEFKQAAMDDWSSGDPPFVYGVVGHDKDSGGVDGNYNNTCCQCYQLVFASPMDPVTGLPTPKPMIVQAFNTAAGGPKNFDVFMAKGGEGANTAGCSSQYSQFPTTGEPNNGGIRALNFPAQCAVMNKFTEASIAAPMCQDQIATQCMTLQSSSSPSVQSTSQVSCVEANQPGNLYHLNWNVLAKRVECPTNLTRVTGCKLVSQGLAQPDPNAKDAASATNGFMSGYTTTTMQDCCRPTCAYAANVTQSGVGADASYGAFYTCDKAGNPS